MPIQNGRFLMTVAFYRCRVVCSLLLHVYYVLTVWWKLSNEHACTVIRERLYPFSYCKCMLSCACFPLAKLSLVQPWKDYTNVLIGLMVINFSFNILHSTFPICLFVLFVYCLFEWNSIIYKYPTPLGFYVTIGHKMYMSAQICHQRGKKCFLD